MDFFAAHGVDKRYLFGGTEYWVDLKQELTAGEERRLVHSGIRRTVRAATGDADPGIELDFEGAAFMKVALYLVDWNIPGPDGKTVDIRAGSREKLDALRALTPTAFAEIERVLDAEVQARHEKKAMAPGSNTSNGPNAI